ncbi:hypothetical protein CXB51_025569 [Gossypium anomalum]|uniref:HMA domain-containing protein n=1 Tax=Gossypium anomalum TaxID=47600 RepID=A0A8J5YAH1_9ROSI|nr:hypothetical protein CXB51_025569 [Gossypium anomalum]
MVPKFERPPVTQINVRMDCNGCVHKIKKALHGIHDEPPPENPQSELAETDAHANQKPPPQAETDAHANQKRPPQPSPPNVVDHSYGGPWSRHHNSQIFQHGLPPQPAAFVTHCYNTYMPSPYVTEYQYVLSPPRYVQYSRVGHCNEDYHNYYINGSNIDDNGNGSIASLFSDDNPKACTIM